MVWDDYYGKQGNPYDAEDFALILDALQWYLDYASLDMETEAQVEALMERTQEALDTELS
tara:strand:- start:218 stop:397 length:180 start_codon:yes stop_codon:yes gene_type:complete